MIDEVLSHTADIHPWFKESRSSRTNPKADWYVWADAKPDGTPPNNWLSIFGGSAWQWDTSRQQYYLHNFLAEQPDLNFHNHEVQDALLDVTRFWLERGVDGFRLDTINFYFHSQGLENNPPLPPEERNDQTAPAVNPYNYQDHLYDKSRPENLGFLERFRALLDEYPATGRGRRSRRFAARAGSGGGLHRRRQTRAYVLFLRLPRAGEDQRRQGTLGAGSLRQGRQRRLVMLGLLQPRRDAPGLALGRRRSRSDRLSQGHLGAADVAARLGLHLSGRGARPWRGGARSSRICRIPTASASGRSSRAATAAARRWCGMPTPGMAASRRQSPGCRCRASISRKPSTCSRATPTRCSSTTGAFSPSAASIRRWPRATSTFIESEGDAVAFTRREGNEQVVCVFNLGSKPAEVDLGGQALQPLAGHGFSGQSGTGSIRLGGYGAWFGRID